MNVRQALVFLAFSALFSSGCTHSLETGDAGYNAVSLALSLKNSGVVPEVQTKMTAVITQDGAGFRGIEQVYVIPFQTESAVPVDAEDTRLGDQNVYINNPTLRIDDLVANNNSHLYNMASAPHKTNRVLAYGKAFDSGPVSTKEGKHRNGVLMPSKLNNSNDAGDISFSLESVLNNDDLTAINQTADNLIAALNGVVEVLQASGDPDFLAFLDVFAFENRISACSYQTLDRFEQDFYGAYSIYGGTNSDVIDILNPKLVALDAALSSAGTGFPTSYGIPEGSVGMWWNGHRFVKLITGVNISLVPMAGYCYPPCLWYYANSPVKTSAKDEVKDEYKPQNLTWGSILSHYTEGTSVQSSTRSVAIVDQLEYGVGLVEFRFVAPIGNAVGAAGCPLTGIIIGDQKDVDFSFAPKSAADSRFVYDNTISGVTLGGENQHVQILVLPTADDQTVHFALEFQNNTNSSFECQQGMVYPNCKFYLAGELEPRSGHPEGISGVFDSDYKTTVYVRVSDLGNAYNTVPDLRDPQLELGVVAEMDWMQVEPGGIKLPF